ncbi:hypothetical protein V5O48_004155 [Marasmius crinis-equi]|uniref:FAD-binding PCMH-type domain-containing protein n=1 Tax=Marasmius crinis-equi TaxID=585013 RepID=A0ABR3FR04_9AGAR
MSEFELYRKSFQGDLVLPGDPDYFQAIERWAVNSVRKARIVAFVKTDDDITLSIRYARNANLSLAIRGGGHSNVGASSAEDGLVIDLSRYFRRVSVDAHSKLAFVEGGAVWKDVDEAVIEHGLAVVGGTVNHTGVAGLTLGGGWGWLQGTHGLTVDNLHQVTLILADGSRVVANDTENTELFWALRGGGCNFGVCTEFVFRLRPQRRTLYAGVLLYPFTVLEDVVDVLNRWSRDVKQNEAAMVNFIKEEDMEVPMIAVVVVYNGSETEGRSNFRALLDLSEYLDIVPQDSAEQVIHNGCTLEPVEDTTSEIAFEKLNEMLNSRRVIMPGLSRFMRGFFNPECRLDVEKLRHYFEVLTELPCQERRLNINLFVEYVNPTKVQEVPDDAMALARHSLNNSVAMVAWSVDTPENTVLGRKAMWEVLNIFAPEKVWQPARLDTDATNESKFQFDEDQDHRMANRRSGKELYGEEKYRKLQKLKRKYDPDLLFNKWFTIEPEPNDNTNRA